MATRPQPEPLNPAGYDRHLADLFAGTAKADLDLDEDEPCDPAADAPWSVVQNIRLTDA